MHLSTHLHKLGFEMLRLKTGTPARVDRKTIDFSQTCAEYGNDHKKRFSFTGSAITEKNIPCHLVHTNPQTHDLIKENLYQSPLSQGKIKGIGPRYCPSIEDKVIRFSDRDRHSSFLEPEGEHTAEIYTQGLSTSLPQDVQQAFLRTISGLEHVEVMRPAYAIEYDIIRPHQLNYTLETKLLKGLYCAGQVNGTSGYEEAAAQGLVAGINAALSHLGRSEIIFDRTNSYVGTLIDDLINKDISEPYRLFTSRSEFRLLLRQDNADLRLTPLGHAIGLISPQRYERFLAKKSAIEETLQLLSSVSITPTPAYKKLLNALGETFLQKETLYALLRRTNIHFNDLYPLYPKLNSSLSDEVRQEVEIHVKYEEFIIRMHDTLQKQKKLSDLTIPDYFDYSLVNNLKSESLEKLQKIRPKSIGQASRIDGVTPSDIAILLVALRHFA
ncbi:MAG: tRNA uridine-5-carboxymethylaminomethyl(34) synthesis enzyme MnmG [Candidatus Margulisiibacteriota bacterium]